jgi:hypothetical protein
MRTERGKTNREIPSDMKPLNESENINVIKPEKMKQNIKPKEMQRHIYSLFDIMNKTISNINSIINSTINEDRKPLISNINGRLVKKIMELGKDP